MNSNNNIRTINDLQSIAKTNKWKLNPDNKVVMNILKGQNYYKKVLGKYYCPCKIQKTDETICPCKSAKNDIEKFGHCHCKLFLKIT